jgi:hypothetical protein
MRPISWPWAAAKNRDSIRYLEYLIREGGSRKKMVALLQLLAQSEKLQLVLEGKPLE